MSKKHNVKKVEVSNAVNVIQAVNATKYSCNMLEENIVDKVVTVDMSKLQLIDVSKLSFVNVVRSCVRRDMCFELMTRYVRKYYEVHSDRSRSQKSNKAANLTAYARENRTAKQLRDVLKEAEFVTKFHASITVSQYKQLVK